MSKYAKYVELTKLSTDYARRMLRLSNRIFGEVARPTNSKSMKVVKLFSQKPINLREEIHSYYPRHGQTDQLMMKLRYYGLYRDEHADFQDEMNRMRTLKGRPKKKRAVGGGLVKNKSSDNDDDDDADSKEK